MPSGRAWRRSCLLLASWPTIPVPRARNSRQAGLPATLARLRRWLASSCRSACPGVADASCVAVVFGGGALAVSR